MPIRTFSTLSGWLTVPGHLTDRSSVAIASTALPSASLRTVLGPVRWSRARLRRRDRSMRSVVADACGSAVDLSRLDEARRREVARLAPVGDRLDPDVVRELFGAWDTSLLSFAQRGGGARIEVLDDTVLVDVDRGIDDHWLLTCRIDARLITRTSDDTQLKTRLRAYWTFDVPGYALRAVEPGLSGAFHERSAAATTIEAMLASEAAIELAVECPPTPLPREVTSDLPAAPAVAALDLAQLEPRFAPHVIYACVDELLRRWEQAGDVDDPAWLRPAATDSAIRALFPRAGWIMRSPTLQDVRIDHVHALRQPPEIRVTVDARSWHGPRDATTAEHSTLRPPTPHRYVFQLALSADKTAPWTLIDARVDQRLLPVA